THFTYTSSSECAPCLILNVSTPSFEQSSLRLALDDSSLRFRHPLARSCHRLDAFNFNKLKNNNFGYRRESRTSLNWLRPSPGCGKTPSSSSLAVDILTSDDHFARVASALPKSDYQDRSSAVWSFYHTSHHQTQDPSVHTSRSLSPPYSLAKLLDQRNVDACAAQRLVSSNTLMQNARQQNSEPHQLRTSPSATTMSKNISRLADCMMKKMPVQTPYHNFSPSPQYRPVLGDATQHTLPLAENVRSATPPPSI
ncbi:hypothetical protein DSO57_1023208, partial [Entomophthora muscae]